MIFVCIKAEAIAAGGARRGSKSGRIPAVSPGSRRQWASRVITA